MLLYLLARNIATVLPVLLQGEIMDKERLRQSSNFFFDKRHRKRVVFT